MLELMGHPCRRPTKAVTSAASLCLLAVLSGCSLLPGSGSSSPSADPPAPAHSAVQRASATFSLFSFTVTGTHPVQPNGSQDTHAQTPGTSCASATFASDHALGVRIAHGFTLAGFPVGAELLTHFLQGKGARVAFPAGSPISKKALASSAFQALNSEVQAEILSQLKAGRTHVRLSAAQLPTVAFESRTTDLYWGFRGTQGLSVTGSGHRAHGRYTGTLTYVIRDSYGFPVGDTLEGFGPPMRYLQTVCGAPQHRGGARWFPDTITVTVPFSRPV
jgi:hypothetical protein